MLPFIEVSHLPSSSSFYSTVTQPLGLRYISTADAVFSPSGLPSITYGLATSPPTPVFELRQVQPTAERPLKHSRVVFSAASPSVVRSFQQRVKEADGRVFVDDDRSVFSQFLGLDSPLTAEDWRLSVKATEADLDGNTMEVVYVPPPTYPEGYSGSTVRKTSSSEGEISRIMTWNYDVAASDVNPFSPATPSSAVSRRSGAFPDDSPMPVIRRTITTTSTTYVPTEPTLSPRQNSSGLTTGAMISTLLGAAAGAAIGAGVAYGAIKHERQRREVEPPSFQRRSTFPEPLGTRSQYSEYGSPRDYQHNIGDRRPPPTLLTRYPHSQSPRDGDSFYDDTRSRHSSRAKPSGASIRTRSDVSPGGGGRLLLTDGAAGEHRSYVSGSRHSARTSEMDGGGDRAVPGPRSRVSGASRSKYSDAAPSLRRSSTYDAGADNRADSYVSSRSQRTASTVRGPTMQPTAQTELTSLVSRPKMPGSSSRVSQRGDSYVSGRETPSGVSAARRMELPMSGAGSSRAGYEREDDLCSIAPSDSISCIGSSRKGSRVYV